MTHAYKSDPSYEALVDVIDRQGFVIVGLEARVAQLEGELRRLRDLVCEDDVAILDEVLHGS